MENERLFWLKEFIDFLNYVPCINEDLDKLILFYKYNYSGTHNLEVIKKRVVFNKFSLEFLLSKNSEKFDKKLNIISFTTEYELLQYLFWEKFKIELKDIFEFETLEKLQAFKFNFYEKKKYNDRLLNFCIEIYKNEKLKKMNSFIIDNIKDNGYLFDVELIKKSDFQNRDFKMEVPINIKNINCGISSAEILNFNILDYKIRPTVENINVYGVNVKFCIESLIDTEIKGDLISKINVFLVDIPNLLTFKKTNENEFIDNFTLNNNLTLLLKMNKNILYSILMNESNLLPIYRIETVEQNELKKIISIKEFKRNVLSELCDKMEDVFYYSNNKIITFQDVLKLKNEFLKRNNYEFKEFLFIEFLLRTTGINLEDNNNINSFIKIIEREKNEEQTNNT